MSFSNPYSEVGNLFIFTESFSLGLLPVKAWTIKSATKLYWRIPAFDARRQKEGIGKMVDPQELVSSIILRGRKDADFELFWKHQVMVLKETVEIALGSLE